MPSSAERGSVFLSHPLTFKNEEKKKETTEEKTNNFLKIHKAAVAELY